MIKNNNYYDLYGNEWSEETEFLDVIYEAKDCIEGDNREDYYIYQNGEPVFRYMWTSEPCTEEEEHELKMDQLPYVSYGREGYYYLDILKMGVNRKKPLDED